MFLKQCKWINRLISISRMKFYADINKDNSSNPRVLFFVHLCLWLQNEQRQFCEEFAPHPGGTNDNDAHSCEPNYIKVQNKIIAKILPVNKFTTPKFLLLLRSMNGYFFSSLLCFALQYMFIQIGSQTWASLSFVPPGLRCAFLAELPLVLIFRSYTKVLNISIWASTQGSLQSQYLFPELEATYSRKSRWGCIAIHQNVCSRSLNQNCQGIS